MDTAAALCAALLDLAAKKDANDAEDENDASNSAKEDANDASNSANPLDPLRAAVLGDAAPLLDAVFAFDARRSVPSSRARVAARVVPSACRAADRLDARASAAAKRRVRSGTSAMISPDAPPSARACGFALLGAFASTVLGPPGASAVAAREDPSLVAALAGGLASDVRAERASATRDSTRRRGRSRGRVAVVRTRRRRARVRGLRVAPRRRRSRALRRPPPARGDDVVDFVRLDLPGAVRVRRGGVDARRATRKSFGSRGDDGGVLRARLERRTRAGASDRVHARRHRARGGGGGVGVARDGEARG